MIKRICAITLLMASMLATPSGATANQNGVAIQDFVQRVQMKWGFTIDPADYEVQNLGAGTSTIIKRRDTPPVKLETIQAGDQSSVVLSTWTEAPPLDSPGSIGVQQDAAWQEQQCYSRHTDPGGVGYIDACVQWGGMNYSGSPGRNYVFRMWATCGAADPGVTFREVDECWVDSIRDPNGPALVWNDWSPKSTQHLSNCGSIQLQVAFGPVSAARSVNTCEKLEISKGAEAADFRATWVGDSYYPEDARETGSLIAIRSPLEASARLLVQWAHVHSECQLSGIFDRCG